MFFAIIKVKLKASKKMFPDTQCTVRCKAGLFVEMPFPFLFLPTSGEWLMKMCENDGFSKLHKKAKCSPGGRSALDPLIHTRKNAERFSSGPWIGSQTITSRHMCKKSESKDLQVCTSYCLRLLECQELWDILLSTSTRQGKTRLQWCCEQEWKEPRACNVCRLLIEGDYLQCFSCLMPAERIEL